MTATSDARHELDDDRPRGLLHAGRWYPVRICRDCGERFAPTVERSGTVRCRTRCQRCHTARINRKRKRSKE